MFPIPSYAQPMVTGVAFCVAAGAAAITTNASAAAARASAAIPTFLISLLLSLSSLPRCFLPSDERVQQSVEGHGHVVSSRLADDRARDQLDLGLPMRVDVLEHRGVVR